MEIICKWQKGKETRGIEASINYSIDTDKKIKENYNFSIEEKQCYPLL